MIATVISIVALLASLFSLGWQLVRARWERPVVVVRGQTVSRTRQALTVYTGDEKPRPKKLEWALTTTIVNVGERAVTVVGWGWAYGSISSKDVAITTIKARGSQIPDFPLRLEPHDSRTWTIAHPMEGTNLRGTNVTPFAIVVQRPTSRELRRGVSAERRVFGVPVTLR